MYSDSEDIEMTGSGSESGDDTNQDYQILSRDELEEEMKIAIIDVQSVLQVDSESCKILLQKFKWNKDSLLERFYESPDTDAFLMENQVIPKETETVAEEGDADCDICCDFTELSGMVCNHRACKECWKMYLMDKIKEGQCSIECMSASCKLLMAEDGILKYIDDQTAIDKYHKLVVDSYVDINSLIVWCPKEECGLAVKVQNSEPQLVTCSCNTSFCFSCGLDPHDPAQCRHLKLWLKKADEMKERNHNGEAHGTDSDTFKWIMSNTRDCPKCLVSIEKNGGCNYMQCRNNKCRYQFCWVCMNAWSVHSQAWYQCNSYNEDADKKREASREDLHRYLFYYTRYFNHKRSLELEQKLRRTVKKKMEKMEARQMRWIEVQFLEQAVNTLSQCRHTMMYTYAFAYYLKRDNNALIFEGNQKDLEVATEQLSGFLERDLDKEDVFTLKQWIQDKCRYVEHRRKILLDHCTEGYEQDFWEFSQ